MSCSSCGDSTSSVMSIMQAKVGVQAATKAAKLVLDTQAGQGGQIVAQLMQAAEDQQKAMVDAMGRLDVTA